MRFYRKQAEWASGRENDISISPPVGIRSLFRFSAQFPSRIDRKRQHNINIPNKTIMKLDTACGSATGLFLLIYSWRLVFYGGEKYTVDYGLGCIKVHKPHGIS